MGRYFLIPAQTIRITARTRNPGSLRLEIIVSATNDYRAMRDVIWYLAEKRGFEFCAGKIDKHKALIYNLHRGV